MHLSLKINPVIIRICLPSVILVSMFASCKKDILDTVPETRLSEITSFSTPQKILAGVNNLYSQVQSENFYGGRYVLYNEQRGEEFSQNDGNANVGALIWQHNPLSTSNLVSSLWTRAYTAINSTNIFITQVSSTTLISEELRDQYLGEAKFVRALSYLSLLQTFAKPFMADNGASYGLPLRLNAETSSANNDLKRSSVAEIYTQIIKDLTEASNTLPVAYSTPALNASRAHKASAIALLTRVYLAKGDYQNVITEAAKIVSSAAPYQYVSGTLTHRLENNIATVFSGSYTGPEALFFIPFNGIDAPGVQSSLAANYLGSIVVSLSPSGILSHPAFTESSTDARRNFIITKNGQKVLTKFPKITSPYTDYIPVIRYAEVLLNYAEAAAELNNTDKAMELLNAVRRRSDPAYVFPVASMGSKEAIINQILFERRLELLGEGFRTFDLQRRVMPFPAKTGAIGSAPAVAPTASNYIWPIPADEVATNKLIEPNP